MTALRTALRPSLALAAVASVLAFACLGGPKGDRVIDPTDRPSGGVPVNPNVLTCGTLADGCGVLGTYGGNECCAPPGDGGGSVCLEAGAPCPPGTGSITCNETADCLVHQSCCGTLISPGDAGSTFNMSCAASCPGPKMQFCRTNGECDNGGKCVVQKCSDGQIYEMCGLFSAANFTCVAQ